MNALVLNILALIVILIFLVLMFFTTTDKNRLYIKFIMLAFPLLRLDFIPGIFKLTTFDCLAFLFFIFFYKRKHPAIQKGNLFLLCFLLILSSSIIGCLNADSLSAATLQDFIRLFSVFIFAKVLLDECVVDASFIYSIISWLKLALIVSLIFLGCQFLFGVEFALEKEINKNVLAAGTRYSSFLSDPQKYAQFLAAVSFLLLIKKRDTLKLPLLNYILLLLSVVAMLLTGGRAAFGGWCLGLFIVILLGKSRHRFTIVMTSLLLLFLISSFKNNFTIFDREQSISESYEFRYEIWKDAYKIFNDHPYFGIGLGNYRNYVSVHNPDQFWITESGISYYDQPESGYLKILSELGLFGFIPVLLSIVYPVYRALIFYFKKKEVLLLFLVASVISWMVGFYTVYSFGDVRIQLLVITIICLIITSFQQIIPD